MNRICQHEVIVKLDKGYAPAWFIWREQSYRVAEVQERWRLLGAWWDGDGEYTFFRVRTAEGGFYELCYNHHNRTWKLSVVQD